MEKKYIEDKTFDKVDFSVEAPAIGEYEGCAFLNCNFLNTDLSGIVFSECIFNGCNLSMVKLTKTALKDCKFTNCKMLGFRFDDCDDFLFAIALDNCNLNHSSFYKRKLKKAKFKDTSFHEVDFVEADLSATIFDNCDLMGAVFADTILEKADLRTAINYSIDPETNRIKKAKFSSGGIAGLLDKYGIEIS